MEAVVPTLDPSTFTTEGPWRGSDITTVRRVCGLTWACGAVIAVPFALLLVPSTNEAVVHVGAVAWLLLALAGSVACLRRPPRIGFAGIFVVACLELAVLTALQSASGGWAAPYWELLGIHAVVVAACFPARVAVPFIVVSLLCSLLPLATGDTAGRIPDVLVYDATWLALCGVGQVAMQGVRARRLDLARRASYDELTELGNRRALADELRGVPARGQVALFGLGDVDAFKRVNDDFGHLVGDACLRDAAAVLRRATAGAGTPYRWAGDEFAVVLSAADEHVLDARRREVERAASAASRCPSGARVGMTFGWTPIRHQDDLDALVERADVAMLARKRERGAAAAREPRAVPQDGVTGVLA